MQKHFSIGNYFLNNPVTIGFRYIRCNHWKFDKSIYNKNQFIINLYFGNLINQSIIKIKTHIYIYMTNWSGRLLIFVTIILKPYKFIIEIIF